MPRPSTFESGEAYYGCLFHELIHSTGHEKRLNRPGIAERSSFGSEKYSIEELIAEIGCAFLCATSGIEQETIDSSASYIRSWIKAFQDDRKMVVIAAAQAQKATDYITEGGR